MSDPQAVRTATRLKQGNPGGKLFKEERTVATKLTTTIADCLEELEGYSYEKRAETLIAYLSERGYEIKDVIPEKAT